MSAAVPAPRARVALVGEKFLPSRGGTSRVIEDLLRTLADRYELTVYCYRSPHAASAVRGVRVVQLPALPFGSLGVFGYHLLCCLHLLWRGQQDVVHVHKTDAAFFLPLLTRRFRCIATSHEVPQRRDKWSAVARLYFRLCERAFVRSRATLTAIARPLAEYYERRYGREVRFIPNGVAPEPAVDRAAAASLLATLGVRGRYLLFAARRVMATKGAHTLLEALRSGAYDGDVVIAGDLDQLPAYTRRLRDLAAGLRVHFAGFVADKATLLGLAQGAELFVFPSETEGMSVMLLEVASVGTPIVASRIPENEAVFGSHEVLYFAPGDAADLAARIRQATREPAAADERARRARERVRAEHDSQAVGRRYAALYDELLQREAW